MSASPSALVAGPQSAGAERCVLVNQTDRSTRVAETSPDGRAQSSHLAPFAHTVGRTRFVVLLAVAAVLLVSIALFVLGAGLALVAVWQAGQSLVSGNLNSTDLTVNLLEVVSTMLKAVVFYLIGVGFYSLFIAPLNLPEALGVETLNDLETKIVSVIVVIMAVTFLEHFILWQQPWETMQFGVTLALVVAALVLFQFYNHRAKEDQHALDKPARAQQQLFEEDEEEHRPEAADRVAGRREAGRQ